MAASHVGLIRVGLIIGWLKPVLAIYTFYYTELLLGKDLPSVLSLTVISLLLTIHQICFNSNFFPCFLTAAEAKQSSSQDHACSCNKDRFPCRRHMSKQEDPQSLGLHDKSISLQHSELPLLPDAKKQDHPLEEFHMAEIPLHSFLSRQSYFCTGSFSP